VTHDVQTAVIVVEAVLAAEVREDRIQIEQVLNLYNVGRTAWQPDDIRMKLPEGATAFNSQASMTDQGVDQDGDSAKLRGTFPPGRHSVDFRWQLPWSEENDVDFAVGLPPHVAIARVMMPASSEIKLAVDGFPKPEVRHDNQGQSFLWTERRLTPQDARLGALSIGIHGLPVPGPARKIVTFLAGVGVLLGVLFSLFGPRRSRASGETSTRTAVLQELADLERAHAAGDVGPKTYERARRELIDALARALAPA
jgi:hypothetical protein